MELKSLIDRTRAGDVAAFTELTRRYQNLAFGYAFGILHDFHLAQDAAQEAFLAAYYSLAKLRDAEAFPAWLRGIVRHQCHRQVRGPVIEAQFAPDDLPELLSALTITDEPRQIDVTVEVAQRLPGGVVRCIATSPAKGLRRGMKVVNTGQPIQEPVDGKSLERAVQLLGTATPAEADLLETGIKVIDLLCPFVIGGKVGLFGPAGVGKLVAVEELVRRIADRQQGVSLFTFVHAADVRSLQEGWTKDPLYTGGTRGAVQTFYVTSERAADPESAATAPFLDAAVYFSRAIGAMGIWPAVDPLVSTSRHLAPAVVGPEHRDVARRARQALQRARELEAAGGDALPEEDRLLVARARKLQRFFSQPFFVAEPFTGFQGRTVSHEETVRSCKAILEGEYDALPEEAFLYVGGVDEAVEKARGGAHR